MLTKFFSSVRSQRSEALMGVVGGYMEHIM
jgi:hypothetical protein